MQHDLTLAVPGARLVPLDYGHAAALFDLVDPQMWAGLSTPLPRTVLDMEQYVLTARETPARYAFAILGPDGAVRGSTSLHEVERVHGRAVIGHTFLGRTWWGDGTNPASKYALLSHAFEDWALHRVALRADVDNVRSVRAIERLGARYEGMLRGHRVGPDGVHRDSASYSILAPEWPQVRAALAARLPQAARV